MESKAKDKMFDEDTENLRMEIKRLQDEIIQLKIRNEEILMKSSEKIEDWIFQTKFQQMARSSEVEICESIDQNNWNTQ